MQEVAVDVAEVLERAVERLADLRRIVGARIVWESPVLALDVRELRLDEDAAVMDRGSNGGFVVMPPLIRSVDPAKALLQRELDERLRALFLPSGTVEKGWGGL